MNIEGSACLNCGKVLDAADRLDDDGAGPERGSIIVCLYCSHVMEWDGEKLVPLSEEAMRAIAGDPEFLELLAFTDFYRKNKDSD